jgi:excisionase family DNA binding protein
MWLNWSGVMDAQTRAILRKPTCTVDQFAKIVGISRNAVYDLVRRKEIKAIRLGRRVVISTIHVRRMLDLEDDGHRGAAA